MVCNSGTTHMPPAQLQLLSFAPKVASDQMKQQGSPLQLFDIAIRQLHPFPPGGIESGIAAG